MKALKILEELLKEKYKNQPLWFGVQNSIEEIEKIHEAIAELEALNSRSCDNCKHLEVREELLKHSCLQEVCRTCTRNNNDNWESK